MTRAKQKKRVYSPETKAAALAVLASCGGNTRAAARQLSAAGRPVPEATLRGWAKQEFVSPPEERQLVEEAKGALADIFESVATKVVRGLDRPEAITRILTRPVQAMTVAGIAVDKLRLLRNEPTDIVGGPWGDLLMEIRDGRARALEVIDGGRDKRSA